MTVRVAQENLPCTIRSPFSWPKFGADLIQMFLPRRDVIHAEREVIVAINGWNRLDVPSDEMQFLIRAQPKPRARKIESGTSQHFQLKHAAIKRATPFHICDVYGDVVKFVNFQMVEAKLPVIGGGQRYFAIIPLWRA
jgi:hypothetical protein